MKAFVTGGTGFVGSHLVESLLSNPSVEETKVLIRSQEKWLKGLAYSPVHGNLEHIDAIGQHLEGIDVLFHCAALLHAPNLEHFIRANVEATLRLVEMALESGVHNIVILSSLAAVGPSNADANALTERSPMRPISNYGRSKMMMEEGLQKLVSSTEQNPKLSIKILRPPAVYGPRETDIFGLFKALNRRIAPVIGPFKQKNLSLIHVHDLVEGMGKSMHWKTPGVHSYFVGGPENAYSWEEIFMRCSSILGKSFLKIPIPNALLFGIARVSELTAPLVQRYPALNVEKANELSQNWVCSSEKAKREWDYSPSIGLEAGLANTLDWYKKQGWLS
jgi:dihydroflavonol-4-reductase